MLTFDEPTHIYRWNGVVVPNVTRIIAPLIDYSMIPPDRLETARQEGIAVHKMVELDCNGQLDIDHLLGDESTAWMKGPYEAWCRFKEETGFECWNAERKMYHPTLRFAGTPDLIGLLLKLKKINGPANLDVKRSLFGGPAIGLQTAAYTKLWNDTDGKKDFRVPDRHRFALELRKNGTYRLTQFEDGQDFVAFLACLQQHRWKEKYYPERVHATVA